LEFEFWNSQPDARLEFSVYLYNAAGLMILNSGSGPFIASEGLVKGVCRIPGDFLNDGIHRVMIMIVQDCAYPIYQLDDALVFDVHDVEREYEWLGKWEGVVRPRLDWTMELSGTRTAASAVSTPSQPKRATTAPRRSARTST
jgi:lipopolysaccharide transport system ATP-binding protein